MSLPTREDILRALEEQRRRQGRGERIKPEVFDNRTNPDGSPLTPGGFNGTPGPAGDHYGRQYAADGCECANCKGKPVRT